MKNTGIAIKNVESEALNSLLMYDSDSSSSSEILNFNWMARDGSESSTSSSSSSSEDEEDDSETTSEDEEEEPQPTEPSLSQNRGAIRKCKPKTDNDLDVEKLPPVPDLSSLNINVEHENFVHMGNVLGIVDKLGKISMLLVK